MNYDKLYNFTWYGKEDAINSANDNTDLVLEPCKKESKQWSKTKNLYIEGDNLDVLKILQKEYSKKIKVIYIDPPYNTDKDFIYNDHFRFTINNYNKIQDNLNFKQKKNDGRYHINWLNMMYPRLMLAKQLLSDDGVIFISIDDYELANLKKICDEIFGEDNFINLINVQTKSCSGATGGGENKRLNKNIEYLLAYKKSCKFIKFNPIYKEENLMNYIDSRVIQGKFFAYTKIITKEGAEHFVGKIKDGKGGTIELYKNIGYEISSVSKIMKQEHLTKEEVYLKYFDKIFTLENAQTSIRDKVIEECGTNDDSFSAYYYPAFGQNKSKRTKIIFMGKTKRLVNFLSNVARKKDSTIIKKTKIGTLWDNIHWNNITSEGDISYNNGKKPAAFITQILKLVDNGKPFTVLDFFAGSASTAHGVMLHNIETGSKINYIMVQQPEDLDLALKNCTITKTKNEIKSIINKLDELSLPHLITEIGKERIKNSGKNLKIKYPNCNIDTGFKVYKTSLKDVEK